MTPSCAAPSCARRRNSCIRAVQRPCTFARPARPILYGCKYLNFSRSNSDMELFGRRVINELEGRPTAGKDIARYTDPDSPCYRKMVEKIREHQNFTTLQFQRLDDLIASVGIEPCKLCTYCWNGKENEED